MGDEYVPPEPVQEMVSLDEQREAEALNLGEGSPYSAPERPPESTRLERLKRRLGL